VKDRLATEGIPLPEGHIDRAIQWRMPQVFKGKKTKGSSGSEYLSCESAE
jgi:hypothetical protein